MSPFFQKIETKLKSVPYRTFYFLIFFFVIGYFSIIGFGFTRVTALISESGYSLDDIKTAGNESDLINILNGLSSVIREIHLLYLLDFIFIFFGLALFFTLNAVLLKFFPSDSKLSLIPKIGFILTIFSRLSDSFENILSLLLYNQNLSHPFPFISILNTITLIKWIIVSFEYGLMLIGLSIVLIQKIQNRKQKNK